MSKRIYAVTNKQAGSVDLVKADTRQQAVALIANAIYSAEAASAITAADLMSKGAKIHSSAAPETGDLFEVAQ